MAKTEGKQPPRIEIKTILKILIQKVPKIPIVAASSLDIALNCPCRPVDRLTSKNNNDCHPKQFHVTFKGWPLTVKESPPQPTGIFNQLKITPTIRTSYGTILSWMKRQIGVFCINPVNCSEKVVKNGSKIKITVKAKKILLNVSLIFCYNSHVLSKRLLELTSSQLKTLSEISRDIGQVVFATVVVSPLVIGIDRINWLTVISGIIPTFAFWSLSIWIVKNLDI